MYIFKKGGFKMSKIQSNFFSVDKNDKNTNMPNSQNDIFIIEESNINSYHQSAVQYIDPNSMFMKDIDNIIGTCKGYEGISFEEIYVDFKNLSEYHYDILSNKHLIVLHDAKSSLYKYITASGKVFLISDIKVLNIINSVPNVFKITMDYVPPVDKEDIMSLSLITKVLFNKEFNSFIELISFYLKPTITINNDTEYSLHYYLFSIYKKLEHYLTKHKMWKYIYLENTIFLISKRDMSHLINYQALDKHKDFLCNRINNLSKEFKIETKNIAHSDIPVIAYKNNLYPTGDIEIQEILDFNNLSVLTKDLSDKEFIDYILENKALPFITHNEFGCIDYNFNIDYNFSNKILIKGSYNDILFKLLPYIIHNKDVKLASSDRKFIKELLIHYNDNISSEPETKTDLMVRLIEIVILARLHGNKSEEDITIFFEKEFNTAISSDDLNEINNLLNTTLASLINSLIKYDEITYKNNNTNLIYHSNLTHSAIALYDKIRLIQKTLIKEVDLYCIDFNKRNKDKIEILYFDKCNIYLCADKSALNTAFDTLTRVMPNVFTRIIPKINPLCLIKVLE